MTPLVSRDADRNLDWRETVVHRSAPSSLDGHWGGFQHNCGHMSSTVWTACGAYREISVVAVWPRFNGAVVQRSSSRVERPPGRHRTSSLTVPWPVASRGTAAKKNPFGPKSIFFSLPLKVLVLMLLTSTFFVAQVKKLIQDINWEKKEEANMKWHFSLSSCGF